MKNTFSVVIFFMVLSLFSACKKKEVVGPQGPAGASSMMKEGFVKGTFYGKDRDGDTIIQSFQYEYFSDYSESSYDDSDGTIFGFTRRSSDNAENYFNFDVTYVNTLSDVPSPDYINIEFRLQKSLSPTTYFAFYDKNNNARLYFNGAESTITFPTYTYDATTGVLKFDFEVNYAAFENSTGNPAVLKGSAEINLKKEVQ